MLGGKDPRLRQAAFTYASESRRGGLALIDDATREQERLFDHVGMVLDDKRMHKGMRPIDQWPRGVKMRASHVEHSRTPRG